MVVLGSKMGILHSVRIYNSLQDQAQKNMSVISSPGARCQARGGADARLCYVLIDFVISVADRLLTAWSMAGILHGPIGRT